MNLPNHNLNSCDEYPDESWEPAHECSKCGQQMTEFSVWCDDCMAFIQGVVEREGARQEGKMKVA